MAKEDVVKMPQLSVLQRLIAKANSAKSKMDTIKGGLGEDIANAVDEHNLHAGAFKLINKLQRMDAVKLMSFLTHFDHYREKLNIDSLAATNLPGLEDDAEEAGQHGDGSQADVASGPGTSQTIHGTDGTTANIDLDENGRPRPMFDA